MSLRLDADFWSARMAYLAKLARTDGLAVVLEMGDEGYVTYVAHNVASSANWSAGAAGAVLTKVMRTKEAEQTGAPGIALADGRPADALLVAPVIWKEQLVGGLAGLAAGRAFGTEEAAAIARIAELVGLELAEANALWRAQRQQQDLEQGLRARRDMARTIGSERDPGQLLERATGQLAEIFGADGVSIMLADEGGTLSVRSSRGLTDAAKADRKRVGEGISGKVAQTGQAVLLAGQVQGGNDATIRESLVAPMHAGDRVVGVVNVKHRAAQDRYGQAQLESLTQVASDIASALLTAEELKRAEEDRRQAIVLYELSRFATLGNDPQNDLDNATAMLADSLRHDAVGVWAVEDLKLRLRASRGYGPVLPSDIDLHVADTTLSGALREGRTGVARFGTSEVRPDWAAPTSTSFVVAPIGTANGVLGALVLGRATTPYDPGEVDFSTTLGDYLSGMLQKSASSGVVERTAATERRRIAQELHDGLAQELTGVVLALEGCQRALDKDPGLLGNQLAKAARDARATLSDVRQYMAALRQSDTGTLNLPTTVARLVDDLKRQSGMHVELEEVGVEQELAPAIERAVIRIVGEALRNVAQHASAQNAKVTLRYDSDSLVATVEDDGKGFAPEAAEGAEVQGHFGIVGMRERAEGVGGQLVVRSEPGRGTIVRASIAFAPSGGAEVASVGSTIDDVEQQGVEDDRERGGFLGRLFGR